MSKRDAEDRQVLSTVSSVSPCRQWCCQVVDGNAGAAGLAIFSFLVFLGDGSAEYGHNANDLDLQVQKTVGQTSHIILQRMCTSYCSCRTNSALLRLPGRRVLQPETASEPCLAGIAATLGYGLRLQRADYRPADGVTRHATKWTYL